MEFTDLFWFVIFLNFIVVASQLENQLHAVPEFDNNFAIPKINAQTFRINQLNFIYSKAEKRLGSTQLNNIYAKFKDFDQQFLAAKETKATGKDPNGIEFMAVEKQLRLFLRANELEDILDTINGNVKKSYKSNPSDENLQASKQKSFREKNVIKLWQDAINAGLQGVELENFEKDLRKYEDKFIKYRKMAEELSEEAHENSILTDNDRTNLKHRADQLKMKHHELGNDLGLIISKLQNNSAGVFTRTEVARLWQMALNSDIGESEMSTLKQELKQLELKLNKLAFLKEESERNRHILNEHDEHDIKAQMNIEKKMNELMQKVTKLENYITKKIRHSEL